MTALVHELVALSAYRTPDAAALRENGADIAYRDLHADIDAAAAGGVFVPVNPLLKPEQVAHILSDCNVRILVTSPERLELLRPALAHCRDLRTVVLVGEK